MTDWASVWGPAVVRTGHFRLWLTLITWTTLSFISFRSALRSFISADLQLWHHVVWSDLPRSWTLTGTESSGWIQCAAARCSVAVLLLLFACLVSENDFVLGVKLLCRIYHFTDGIKGQFTQQRNFLPAVSKHEAVWFLISFYQQGQSIWRLYLKTFCGSYRENNTLLEKMIFVLFVWSDPLMMSRQKHRRVLFVDDMKLCDSIVCH